MPDGSVIQARDGHSTPIAECFEGHPACPRVLLVDDELSHLERLGRELETLGCAISLESNPVKALARARATSPDWVCVEPQLPGGSWVRFLHALVDSAPGSRWLVVTGFPSSALTAEAMKLGATDVLMKPVSGRELFDVCRGMGVAVRAEHEVDLSLAHLEWEHLNKVLRLCDGNVTKASRALGITRQGLYNKLRKAPPTLRVRRPTG